jgi:protein TonB
VKPLGRRALVRRQRAQASTGLALSGTLVLHVAMAGLLFTRPEGRASRVPVYAVQLVAAPAPAPEARRAPEVVERPAAQPEPTIARRPPPRRTSQAREAPPPTPTPAQREPAPRTNPNEQLAPGVQPSTGTDVATVSLPGVAFPYPEYLRNIVSEVFRRWHRPLGETPLQAEVMFFIHRDGSISNLQFIKRSGSFAFDLEAEGAVEAAGSAKAFGALPQGYPADVLPVSFFFNPGAIR